MYFSIGSILPLLLCSKQYVGETDFSNYYDGGRRAGGGRQLKVSQRPFQARCSVRSA
jgi:hypothetical protein